MKIMTVSCITVEYIRFISVLDQLLQAYPKTAYYSEKQNRKVKRAVGLEKSLQG